MRHADFLTLAGTLLPVLLLAVLIDVRRPLPLIQLDAPTRVGPITVTLRSRGFLTGTMFNVPITCVIVSWAEYVCLRGLETGRAPAGGLDVVWAALGYIALMLVLRETIRAVAEIQALKSR